ncbi:hypothetical protein RJD24_02695 [Bacillaceae bacterium IKA-2]|nr:hypothetical protein RJD24_02695 [Bacillaceae bacterium IKA-2]
MKKIVIFSIVLVSILTIVFSRYQYDQKLKTTASEAQTVFEEIKIENEQIKEIEGKEAERERLRLLTTNMAPSISQIVNEAVDENGQVNIVVVGSDSLVITEERESWLTLVQSHLDQHYEGALFSVESVIYDGKSSYEVLAEQGYTRVIEKKPDILIVEPFLLNDNGIALISDTLNYLEVFLSEIKEIYEDIIVIIQPPAPLYQSAYYLTQVEEINAYSDNNNYIYFDHWTNWPDSDDEGIKDFLDGKIPNQEGHKLWAEYINNYFVARDIAANEE